MPEAEPSPEPGSADPATKQTTRSGAGSAEPATSTEAEKPRAPARRRWRSLSAVARLAVIHDRHPDHPDHLDLSEFEDDARDIASASPRARAVEGGLLERALSAAVHHGEEDESGAASEPPAAAADGWLLRVVAPELAGCSDTERAYVWKARLIMALETWAGGFSNVAGFELVLALCGGDSVVLAGHSAVIASANSLLATFLTPVVSSLSDSRGRRPFMVATRSGWMLWMLAQPRVGSLAARATAAIIFNGILNAGVQTVTYSCFSDLFGFQVRGLILTLSVYLCLLSVSINRRSDSVVAACASRPRHRRSQRPTEFIGTSRSSPASPSAR